jgi:gluconate 5-dehydrogenase
MTSLDGVGVFITGATTGIGRAMASALLDAGASVVAAARSPALEAVVDEWRSRGLAATALALDVRDERAVEGAARRALEILDSVDLVVNNAGIGMRTVNPQFMVEPMPFWEVPPGGFRDVVDTNLTGYFLVARAFAPRFVERGRGRFVNVTVRQQTMRARGFTPYGPSRAGSEAFSEVMTEDLRPFGVTCNLLAPGGATATEMIPETVPDEIRRNLLPPEIMGEPIVFLASAEAEGVTGERITAADWDAWLADFRLRARSEGRSP